MQPPKNPTQQASQAQHCPKLELAQSCNFWYLTNANTKAVENVNRLSWAEPSQWQLMPKTGTSTFREQPPIWRNRQTSNFEKNQLDTKLLNLTFEKKKKKKVMESYRQWFTWWFSGSRLQNCLYVFKANKIEKYSHKIEKYSHNIKKYSHKIEKYSDKIEKYSDKIESLSVLRGILSCRRLVPRRSQLESGMGRKIFLVHWLIRFSKLQARPPAKMKIRRSSLGPPKLAPIRRCHGNPSFLQNCCLFIVFKNLNLEI